MSWGAGGRSVDEMLHAAAVADEQRHAETRRAAALTIAGHLGPDCRDVLEACGLIGYLGHDRNLTTRRNRHGGVCRDAQSRCCTWCFAWVNRCGDGPDVGE